MSEIVTGNIKRILPFDFRTALRLGELGHNQAIFTLFIAEEGIQSATFTIQSLSYYDNSNDTTYGADMAHKTIPEILELMALTTPNLDAFEGIHPYDNIDVSGILNGTISTGLDVLTLGGTLAFNFYFRTALDLCKIMRAPLNTHYGVTNNTYVYWQDTDTPQITAFPTIATPSPTSLQTLLTSIAQYDMQRLMFFYFLYEEGFQLICKMINHLQYNKNGYIGTETRGHLAGYLANYYMTDLLGLMPYVQTMASTIVTKMGSYAFAQFYAAVYHMFAITKNQYDDTLGQYEYYQRDDSGNLTTKTTYDPELFGVSKSGSIYQG